MTEFLAITIGLLGLGIGSAALWRGHVAGGRATSDATDELTGLCNRRRFDRDVESHAGRGDEPTAILMIDVDQLGTFNRAHGLHEGDDVLRTIGSVVARLVRQNDVAYRYSGEQFAVLLTATDAAAAVVVAERIRRSIETAALPVDGRVTISAGVASGSAEEVMSIVGRADDALFEAKRSGRNNISIA
jgi:diguanylate cyclase (GGDEF)-like protein